MNVQVQGVDTRTRTSRRLPKRTRVESRTYTTGESSKSFHCNSVWETEYGYEKEHGDLRTRTIISYEQTVYVPSSCKRSLPRDLRTKVEKLLLKVHCSEKKTRPPTFGVPLYVKIYNSSRSFIKLLFYRKSWRTWSKELEIPYTIKLSNPRVIGT